MVREKKIVHKVQRTKGKRNIIQMRLQGYDQSGQRLFSAGNFCAWYFGQAVQLFCVQNHPCHR